MERWQHTLYQYLAVSTTSKRLPEVEVEVMTNVVAPGIAALIAQAARQLVENFQDDPITTYLAQEVILHHLAEWLTLKAIDADSVIRPALLTPEYARYWFDVNQDRT